MAKFRYNGPGETTTFGITFEKGEIVEVLDENAIKKLTGNPCFDNCDGEDKKRLTVAEMSPLVAVASLEELDAFAEGETRAMVLAAIEKRRNELGA